MADDLTLNDMLFDAAPDAPHSVARRLLAMPSALDVMNGWAVARRATAELQMAAQVASVLGFDASELVVNAWKKAAVVQTAVEASRQHPSDEVIVPMATHHVRGRREPVIEIYIGSARLARFELMVDIDIELSGAEIKLQAGQLGGVASGSWAAEVALWCGDSELARRCTGRRSLPGTLRLVPEALSSSRTLRLAIDPAPCSGPATIDISAPIVIGRHPSCGLVLWDDPAVSSHHAGIHLLGAITVLEDLGSVEGTYLNGRRMNAPAILQPGDEVTIGRRRLKIA
jgi:hypothetical protein